MLFFLFPFPQADLPHRTSLVAETTTIEIHREDPEEELGMRIVGGKDTPLGNIVVQEVLRDSVIAADGRIAPGDHILEVGNPPGSPLGWGRRVPGKTGRSLQLKVSEH